MRAAYGIVRLGHAVDDSRQPVIDLARRVDIKAPCVDCDRETKVCELDSESCCSMCVPRRAVDDADEEQGPEVVT